GALHEELAVGRGTEYAGYRGEKTRPSGAAVEFHRRSEKRQAAACADEHPRALFPVQRARPGPLGAFVAQHVVGRGRESLLPFGVRDLERFRARGHVRALGKQGFPVFLKIFHFHGSFRGLLSPSGGAETRQRQRRQTSQPVATIHFFTSLSRQYRPPFGPGIPAGAYMTRTNRARLTMSTMNAHELWLATGLRTQFARVDGPLARLDAAE